MKIQLTEANKRALRALDAEAQAVRARVAAYVQAVIESNGHDAVGNWAMSPDFEYVELREEQEHVIA